MPSNSDLRLLPLCRPRPEGKLNPTPGRPAFEDLAVRLYHGELPAAGHGACGELSDLWIVREEADEGAAEGPHYC